MRTATQTLRLFAEKGIAVAAMLWLPEPMMDFGTVSRSLSRRTVRWNGHPAGMVIGLLSPACAWVPFNFIR